MARTIPTATAISISHCDHGLVRIHLIDANGHAFAVAGFTAERAKAVAGDLLGTALQAGATEHPERVH